MTETDRVEKARAYAKARLKKEIDENPRGASAALSRALKVKTATISNLRNQNALPGMKVLPKLAAYWGLTLDELIAEANGERKGSSGASVAVVSDRVLDVIARVGKANGFTNDEVEAASGMMRGLTGVSMTEDQALDHLETVRGARRRQERAFRSVVEDRGTSALEEMGGGRSVVTQSTRKKR